MSRCFICDYSSSADSIYNDGVYDSEQYLTSNRVIYNKQLDKDVCLACVNKLDQQANYWTYIDDDNTFLLDEEVSETLPIDRPSGIEPD